MTKIEKKTQLCPGCVYVHGKTAASKEAEHGFAASGVSEGMKV